MRFKASMIRPMVASSGESPSSSPQAVRTAGATWATTIFSGSSMASQTFSVSSLAVSAPTGQWVMHWPQSEQSASSMVFLPETLMVTREPVPSTVQIPSPWTFSQIWTQRMHLMHFSDFRNNGKFLFHGWCSNVWWKGISKIFRSLAIF